MTTCIPQFSRAREASPVPDCVDRRTFLQVVSMAAASVGSPE